jgi:hypothetical protein
METPEEVRLKRINHLTALYTQLVGKAFDELDEDQLRVLYAWELWGDGMDIDEVCKSLVFSKDEEKLAKEFIVLQLKMTFGYQFNDLVEED